MRLGKFVTRVVCSTALHVVYMHIVLDHGRSFALSNGSSIPERVLHERGMEQDCGIEAHL